MVAELNRKVGNAVESKSNWLSSMFSREKDKGDAISASALNVTKIVSISVALFAAITQVLDAIGAISLSTTQQVTIWLVAAGFIVLLSIADMTCRAYVTAKTYRSLQASVATPDLASAKVREPTEQRHPDLRVIPTDGNAVDDDASTPQNGPRLPVNMADVFPQGCYLVPDSIGETYDYDEKTKTRRPSIDKITGKQIYQCRVVYMDPESKGRSRETVVKIVADQTPVPPTQAPYESVEFEGLTAAPYAIDRDRTGYTSLRATGIKQAPPRQAPVKDVA